ncbi:MAG: SMP-30/gluconolactonase/LRE family protein [Acidobacteria bacterium]|nr:SMP-30/gluconolactonase/LRE family protein [Acidobacteriota bacterium]
MRRIVTLLIASIVCVIHVAPKMVDAQAANAPVVVGSTTEIAGVVRSGTPIERILTGFNGLDDPIGLTDGSLLFSEPNTRRIHRLNTATNEVSVLIAESNESHGVTEDSKGRLISAQAWDGSTRIGVIYPPAAVVVLADNFEGSPFSRPNDLIVTRNGGVYFTEPGLTVPQAAELTKRLGKPLGPRLPAAVYYIPPGRPAIRIEDRMIRPNGIQLSRDEKMLFVSDSNGAEIIAWDIQSDGLVRNRRPFGAVTGRSTRDNGLGGVKSFADGMTIDDDGRLYVATGGGVEVLGAEGRHLGTIPVRCPPADCQNLAFSGPDKATLYVGGAGSLYRIAMVARGFRGRAK